MDLQAQNTKLREIERRSRTSAKAKLRALGLTSVSELFGRLENLSERLDRKSEYCEVIGNLRAVEAIPVLVRIIGEATELNLVWAAAHALVSIKSRQETRGLVQVVVSTRQHQNRQAAVYVLGFLRDTSSREVLQNIASNLSEDVKTRSLAVEALAGFRRSVPVLMRLLGDSSADIRYSALCALSASISRSEVAEAIKKLRADTGRTATGLSIKDLAIRLTRRKPKPEC